ncbi:CaiB/BaiF CoA-transferase family protein [Aneurinibacillus sp. Ricciae_BoGa-3]|uniref:CaiB/BaiF CoA transferase family protein n=1 Tax=Aneurinibacillus sp. Ricciae_BoGa-3 TaxID=3022697 RepID=UPI002340BD36|nr:CaiB/BaiF CoA-transferase family protein [Aneurinibacillus sp. Ricciae_BoGa-3]WCK56350.1 CaiB/BaiF CoA-transferase family protein [Aneurinibacillus sp. Ricciae_BoGa-3]
MLPLEGITVVSLEQAVAAPFATRQLADLGARVIKIERPEVGDFARQYDSTVKGMSSHFIWCNRSKESLTLNLKKPEAKQVLDELLEKADVFIQNLAPGAVHRLGYSPASLLERYPELIVCSISGYGESGPYRDKKAYDLLIQCEAGVVSITGTEETPSKTGISIADICAGMYAYSGILTALLARAKSGKGTILEVSMLEALGEWMGYPMYYAGYGGNDPKRTGASHATIYPYGSFPTGDGKTIFLGIQNEREWDRFCENVLQQPNLKEDARFINNSNRDLNRHLLKPIIDTAFKKLTSDEIIDRLDTAQIANARMNTMKEFFEHPQLEARNRWRTIDSPVGLLRSLIPPVTMKEMEIVMKPIPELGEHNELILKELGFEKETINDWREQGVI